MNKLYKTLLKIWYYCRSDGYYSNKEFDVEYYYRLSHRARSNYVCKQSIKARMARLKSIRNNRKVKK